MDIASIADSLSGWQVGILMRLSNEWRAFYVPERYRDWVAGLVEARLVERDYFEDTARLTELGEQVKQVIIERGES